jgi:hypothetical protein
MVRGAARLVGWLAAEVPSQRLGRVATTYDDVAGRETTKAEHEKGQAHPGYA